MTVKELKEKMMLANVSARLGVDMQRLILAYGQVKAANYLRGQELRQFSEAGINILGELATYFSELQNKAISTADVFEMVSKRMVKFSDVEVIFKRLTESGGIFYNMQEIQAETLQGMFFNRLKKTNMKAHEFIRETFDLDNRTSISELPDLPISLIVEMLNNYKEGKVKKLLIPRVSVAVYPKCGCNKITGDGIKDWCLNSECDFIEAKGE